MTLHQRLGRKIAVTLGALSMLVVGSVLPTVAPAAADHGIGYSHWSNFEWASTYAPNSIAERGFYVLDRTGHSTMGSAMQDAINHYSAERSARGLQGVIPNIVRISEPQYAGLCGWYPEFSGYHFITICQRAGLNAETNTAGPHNAEPNHPYILVGNGYGTNFAAYRNLIYHELFHAAGIAFGPCTTNSSGQTVQASPGDHSCDPANLLYTHVPTNVVKNPTQHDWDALWAGYVNHPIFS